MKDLKAFLEVMGKDNELSEKVRCAKDVKEMVKIANEAGYSVTEDEMNDFLMQAVAGGSWEGLALGVLKDGFNTFGSTFQTGINTLEQGGSLKDVGRNMAQAAVTGAIRTTTHAVVGTVNEGINEINKAINK